MARKLTDQNNFGPKPTLKRPGVHAKNHNSKHKASKNYRKVYRGQGKV